LLRKPRSVASFVAQFKAAATRRVNMARRTPAAALWQRNYYEHVIRDADDYEAIRWYIETNPTRWALDEENPLVFSETPSGPPSREWTR
jgi:putative transposase